MPRALPLLAGLLLVALFGALHGPDLYLLVIAAGLGAAGAVMAYQYNETASAVWLLVTGCTLEMWLGDLIGPTAYQPIIAVVKTVGLGLALLAILRVRAPL